jgi:hypothetical protein
VGLDASQSQQALALDYSVTNSVTVDSRTDMLCQPQHQSIGVRRRHSIQNVFATFHGQGVLVSIQLAGTSGTLVNGSNLHTIRRTFTTWGDDDGRVVAGDTPRRMACGLAIASR